MLNVARSPPIIDFDDRQPEITTRLHRSARCPPLQATVEYILKTANFDTSFTQYLIFQPIAIADVFYQTRNQKFDG